MNKAAEYDKVHSVLRLFIHTNRLHMKALDCNVGNIGLHRGQHMMLMTLSKYKESAPSQKELASKLSISPAAVTVVLQKLEKSGYIERSTTNSDNRCNEIYITATGRKIIAESQEYFSQAALAMFEGFSQDELDSFGEQLKRIYGNLENFIEENQKGEEE